MAVLLWTTAKVYCKETENVHSTELSYLQFSTNDLTLQTNFLDARLAEMNLHHLVIESGTFDPLSCSLIWSFEQDVSDSNSNEKKDIANNGKLSAQEIGQSE